MARTASEWRESAAGMLETERRMRPLHRPPSRGCFVAWRDQVRVGMIQHPIDPDFPAIVFISITSRHLDAEYIRAVRNLDPGRLLLTADDGLDLQDNFHVLRREGDRLSCMTPSETRHIANRPDLIALTQVQPTSDGVTFQPIAGPAMKLYRRTE